MAAYTYPSYVLSISNTYDTMAEITSPIDELNDLVDAGLLVAEIPTWHLFIRDYDCTASIECRDIDRYTHHRAADCTFFYALHHAPGHISCEGMVATLLVVRSHRIWPMPPHTTSAQWSYICVRASRTRDAWNVRY